MVESRSYNGHRRKDITQKVLPISPMNIIAGGKLYTRKPKVPANKALQAI